MYEVESPNRQVCWVGGADRGIERWGEDPGGAIHVTENRSDGRGHGQHPKRGAAARN